MKTLLTLVAIAACSIVRAGPPVSAPRMVSTEIVDATGAKNRAMVGIDAGRLYLLTPTGVEVFEHQSGIQVHLGSRRFLILRSGDSITIVRSDGLALFHKLVKGHRTP